jgi:hypothetical protein
MQEDRSIMAETTDSQNLPFTGVELDTGFSASSTPRQASATALAHCLLLFGYKFSIDAGANEDCALERAS